jgi:hypothetical protein
LTRAQVEARSQGDGERRPEQFDGRRLHGVARTEQVLRGREHLEGPRQRPPHGEIEHEQWPQSQAVLVVVETCALGACHHARREWRSLVVEGQRRAVARDLRQDVALEIG